MPYRPDLDGMTYGEVFNHLKREEWCFDPDGHLLTLLPGNGGGFRSNLKDGTWRLSGTREAPTITPSIHVRVEKTWDGGGWETVWHGFLTNGQWRSV